MTWLGPAQAGWQRVIALVFVAVTAGAPCLARSQDADAAQQLMLATPTISGAPGDAAAAAGLDDRGRALDCMSMAIAYEAAGQPVEGQQAVGQVILNRMRAARFPKTVCGVVFQGSERVTGCQFTFTCDGSYRRRLADATLETARGIAASVLDGIAPDRVSGATHYHADYVLPYWASSGQRVARIGAHIFYRMRGDAGRAGSAAVLAQPEPELPVYTRWTARRVGVRTGARVQLAQAAVPPPPAVFAPWGLTVGVAQR